jgi:hypothetical protein
MEFWVVGAELYNDQRNAQFLNLFNYLLLPYMFRVGMVSALWRWHHTQQTWTTAEFVHLPLKMG